MILVDTSVWIDHLRGGDPALTAALEGAQVLMHPFVLGELACGIGYIDIHLLASAALAGTARLWTRDKRLAAVATELRLAFTAVS